MLGSSLNLPRTVGHGSTGELVEIWTGLISIDDFEILVSKVHVLLRGMRCG